MKKVALLFIFTISSISFCNAQKNKGRIQIIGSNFEHSKLWSKSDTFSKNEGLKKLNKLWNSLSKSERADRRYAYANAKDYILRSRSRGRCVYDKPLERTFKNNNPNDPKAGIVIIIKKGCAFGDK